MNPSGTSNGALARVLDLANAGRLSEALAACQQVCAAEPRNAQAWFLCGAIHGQSGNLDGAIRCGHRAVELDPGHAGAHFNLGQAYRRLNRHQLARASFEAAVKARADYAEAWDSLGYLYQEAGQNEQAIACYRRALQLRPDFAGTAYLLAALGVAPVPPSAPADYVRGLFDGFSAHFDDKLVGQLQYRTPWELARAMEGVIGAPRGDRDVLDLGCGTGLCGQAFRGYASRLVGTDLSAGMIAKARERGVYNELYCEDILVTLERMPGQFDVILSADVFVYIGDLARVFDAAEAALRPGGWFAFSVERGAAGTTYALHSANRYTHSADYVRDLARCNGLQEAKFADVVLRVQNGEPVAGYVVLLQREAVRGMPDAYG